MIHEDARMRSLFYPVRGLARIVIGQFRSIGHRTGLRLSRLLHIVGVLLHIAGPIPWLQHMCQSFHTSITVVSDDGLAGGSPLGRDQNDAVGATCAVDG